jgi:ribonuclease HI
MKNSKKLFCDGSVNPQKKIGYGSYFICEEFTSIQKHEDSIQSKMFQNTSSTKLELEALLWALEDNCLKGNEVYIYTDCQNILSLLERRDKLESNDYHTSTGKLLKNHDLYKKFYALIDNLQCTFIKVKGHKKSSLRDEIDVLFNLVDKASRKALRDALV